MIAALLATRTRKVIASILVSSTMVAGVAQYEGFSPVAYHPVPQDSLTIGHGYTKREDGSPVRKTDIITLDESKQRLKRELFNYKQEISKCIKVPVTENEASAYISLSYNIGTSAFCGSSLVKKLNQYDYAGACQEILKWDKFKGKALRGLTMRRTDEYKTCIKE